MKILVIDDWYEPLKDHDVTVVESYREAVSLLGTFPFEVVLMNTAAPMSVESSVPETDRQMVLARLFIEHGTMFVGVVTPEADEYCIGHKERFLVGKAAVALITQRTFIMRGIDWGEVLRYLLNTSPNDASVGSAT